MKRLTLTIATAVLVAGCSSSTPTESENDAELGTISSELRSSHKKLDFVSHMTGDEEVPPRETPASGRTKFDVNRECSEVDFRLFVRDIKNVVAAHIHLGAPEVNGPVVAFLYGPVPPGGGSASGLLASGTITAADLVGPLAGQPLSALLDAMDDGGAYVNVHTNDGVAPADTGPGDFPAGEIRGQIYGVRKHLHCRADHHDKKRCWWKDKRD